MLGKIPAVSIIIPMYNTEKYIGECLDSILNQTFTDYEVIVVDDCSTDNSCAIVESYLPKFGDKLQLIKSEKNSGGCPGIPRNIGIRLSLGEYILFVDSDDAITPTALDELYHLAKKFNADVVHCGKYYIVPDKAVMPNTKLSAVDSLAKGTLATEPTLLTDNLEERLKLFVERRINWITFCNFVRKKFIMRHNINFPNMSVAEDVPYTLKLLCESKNFLCLPNLIYIYRIRKNSQSHKDFNVDKHISHRILSVFRGIEYIDEYMRETEFFVKHPNYKYDVLNFFKELQTYDVLHLYSRFPVHKLDGLIRRELDEVSDKTALTAFLFNRMNIFNLQVNVQNELIRKMETYIKKQALISEQRDSELESVQNYISELQAEIHRLKEKLNNSRSNH